MRKGEEMKVFTVRFWNAADECINVGGKYGHDFDTFEDAWNAANALLLAAHKKGAVEMDINNDFYPIIEEEER